MWGGNGKNHSWSMGHHWLVALFVLQATLVHADFMSHDSQNLQQILFVLGGGASDGNSIWALVQRQNPLLTSIDSRLSPVSTISSDVATIKQYLDYNLNGDGATDSMSVHDFIQEFNRKFFQGVDRFDRTVVANPATVSIFSPNGYSPFIEPGKSFQNRYTSQISVTNIAETAQLHDILTWITRISTNVENSYYVPFDPNIYFAGYINSSYPADSPLNQYYGLMLNYYSAQHNRDLTQSKSLYKDILRKFGSWKWQALQTYLVLNPDLLTGTRVATNGMVRTLNTILDSNNVIDGNMNRVYRDSYYDQYATRPLREYFMSPVQDGRTNTIVLNNIISEVGASAIVDNEGFSNLLSKTSNSLSSNINTNEIYLGSYASETNSNVFADIITNGVEVLEGNQVYSSLGDDVDASFFSNKVSKFNFIKKFDYSIKPFLDEIENASGGDWIINFGNVNLGDHFSFTIPALIVERNETYLGFVDKFLNVLKIILTFAFFLILWNQLGRSVEST